MPYEITTIGAALSKVHPQNPTWFIPVMQRPYVWKTPDILALFNSIYSGYPIGTSLVWPTTYHNPNNDGARRVYVVHAHQAEELPPVQANVQDGTDITLVLDGQQRLTSLAVGVFGTWTSNKNGPMQLFFDPTAMDNNARLAFLFVPQGNVPDNHLIRLAHIPNWESDPGFEHFLTNYFNSIAGRNQAVPVDMIEENIRRLRTSIWETEAFCYGVYHAGDLQDALNAFQLANSTGKELEKTDLLMATLQVAWANIPLRRQLPERFQQINQRFQGNNPITTKNYLNVFVQSSEDGLPPGYRWSDLTPEVINNLRDYWGIFQNKYVALVEQLSLWGMTRSKCVSAINALLPILAMQARKNFRFEMENNVANAEVEKVRQWLLVVLMNRTFGGQSTAAVRDAFRVIDQYGRADYFPQRELFGVLENHHRFDFQTRDGLTSFVEDLTYQGGALQVRQLLMLLKDNTQPASVVGYEIDHIFPRNPYADQHPNDIHKVWNLQLLTAPENTNKTNQTPAVLYHNDTFSSDWRRHNMLPENDQTANVINIWDDPTRLWNARRDAIVDRLCQILNVE